MPHRHHQRECGPYSPCDFPYPQPGKRGPRGTFCRQSWHRRLSQKAAPAPIPSHGRRKGAHLAHHAALWAARRSLGVTEAALAAGIGGGWAWRALGSRSGQKKALNGPLALAGPRVTALREAYRIGPYTDTPHTVPH